MHLTKISFVLSVGVSASVIAQCDPVWDTALGNPGISAGYIQPMLGWDDGTGEKFYVGGSAQNIGGGASVDHLGQYDPTTGNWSRVGLGIDGGGTNAFLTRLRAWDDGNGEMLYVSGFFAEAGFVADTKSIAAWDGNAWHSIGAGFPDNTANAVYDMYPADLGNGERLYIFWQF
ncbi:MAG: hypothetical protein COB69_08930 [Phycisphaera sp.]|nr:MAG: hypothetical protein COB69_08930 [Phycisphaera sp.]